MVLSLSETARLLGKSERQVRYLIRSGKLPAKKKEGRWLIQREALGLSGGQEKAQQAKSERAARLVQELLAPHSEGRSSKKTYSIRDLRAFREGAPLYRDLAAKAGADHPATGLLHEAMMLLACGYHEFDGASKAELYARARNHASRATMALLLDDKEACQDLIERLEASFLPALGGLIHQAERRGRRRK